MEVGRQALLAYEPVVRRMLAGPGVARLRFEVDLTSAAVDAGGTSSVQHLVVLRDGDGAEVQRWAVRGESPIIAWSAPR